ncbi:hypothetical protein BO83DRAFT_112661 [Aspergillus eucalypticola CBS 122712]|uniref:Uncharacterized protein n=1 Tax=Aspergillus eucalypticola (strain CBS 122712 / IBT 29274) TaxID=1448314 RepID=A0A317V0C0_ASPEC|nr:uncharacterized protein BO83DRAFT_112661 [Aspergillus eucalypticola CBS 122712]PWY66242.1 hypothetical protein BO83DRAFT_112661 [Aspergillus eucalypticola CBS 122712]
MHLAMASSVFFLFTLWSIFANSRCLFLVPMAYFLFPLLFFNAPFRFSLSFFLSSLTRDEPSSIFFFFFPIEVFSCLLLAYILTLMLFPCSVYAGCSI